MAPNSRAKKTGKDRTAQITKERPLRVAMGPQGKQQIRIYKDKYAFTKLFLSAF
jgi:hypothetical protein